MTSAWPFRPSSSRSSNWFGPVMASHTALCTLLQPVCAVCCAVQQLNNLDFDVCKWQFNRIKPPMVHAEFSDS